MSERAGGVGVGGEFRPENICELSSPPPRLTRLTRPRQHSAVPNVKVGLRKTAKERRLFLLFFWDGGEGEGGGVEGMGEGGGVR